MKLVSDLKDTETKTINYFENRTSKELLMSEEDEVDHNESEKFHFCNNELCKDKVRDHLHLPGKYKRAGHDSCDIKGKQRKFAPVSIHNLGKSTFVITKHRLASQALSQKNQPTPITIFIQHKIMMML